MYTHTHTYAHTHTHKHTNVCWIASWWYAILIKSLLYAYITLYTLLLKEEVGYFQLWVKQSRQDEPYPLIGTVNLYNVYTHAHTNTHTHTHTHTRSVLFVPNATSKYVRL